LLIAGIFEIVKMATYISSAVSISPQKSFDRGSFLNEFIEYTSNRLYCVEPDYNTVIDVKLGRRMSRIIRMSVACALACLKDAGIENPGAITTGTAYGCLEDTGAFLTSMIEQNEEPIMPTAFVQSTHNTIGAQVALLLKCHRYNNTFVNGGSSLENALLDAAMLLAEDGYSNVLVGGMDEITDASHAILTRTGLYKRHPESNRDLFASGSKGTINGEGAAFFLLTNVAGESNLARLDAVAAFYKPGSITDILQHLTTFLNGQSLNSEDISLLVTGENGDPKNDEVYAVIKQELFDGIPFIRYKHLCGEYPTSSAFAVWLAAHIIKTNSIPEAVDTCRIPNDKIKKVLIYNHYQNSYHCLILLSAC
jgi:3-oxoacyl-[acyl-carrier-protein] synthase II